MRTFRVANGLRIVTIDRDDDGMRMDILEERLSELKAEGVTPKFIYTIPSPQNPDGSIMPTGAPSEDGCLWRRNTTR